MNTLETLCQGNVGNVGRHKVCRDSIAFGDYEDVTAVGADLCLPATTAPPALNDRNAGGAVVAETMQENTPHPV